MVASAHTAIGVRLYRQALADIGRDRLVDAVPHHGERAAAFWFLLMGPTWWLVGRQLRAAEADDDLATQRVAGWVLTASAVTGVAAMPRSGFWALGAIGLSTLRRSRRRSRESGVRPRP